MRNSKEYLKKLANKIILETLEGKADEVMEKIKSSEFDYVAEGDVCEQCGGTELFEGECVECGTMKSVSEMLEKLHGGQRKLDKNKNGRLDREDFKMLRKQRNEGDCMECGGGMKGEYMEGETCECGNYMEEGMCMECGKMKDSEILEFGSGQAFTGGMELEEKWKGDVKVKKTGEHAGKSISDIDARIKALKDLSQSYQDKGERVPKKLKEKMSELYFAKRSKKGWPGKGKVDVDEEVEEGNLFSGERDKAIKAGKSSFNVDGKTYPVKETLYRLVDGDESALFTENEIIDIIENIVKEEKDNIKKGVTPKGLGKYEKIHKESGKENKDYLDSVVKKFASYLKPGSKVKYDTNPKNFPKGNGDMDKKAYEISEDGQEFIDDFYKPGMHTLDFDEVHPNEELMDNYIEGSSKTGNNNEWANAEQTEVNKKLNKTRKKGLYNKAKRKAYDKSPQPVIVDKPGQENGSGLHLNMENHKNEKEVIKLNEEFDRIKKLMGYSQKTQ